MSEDMLYNIIGLVGPALFVFAYAMVAADRWHGKMRRFHVVNFLGSVAVIISLMHHWNMPTFIVEICWAMIAAYGFIKTIKYSKL